ncbi:hypothetical protein [Massilia sp. Se16.2.3]|uniref:hypothetical protein n=1 Tax=Massilia sp. Se16.2.3 TaxID=2709303 RepID=UPI001E39AAA3|nr:hypothetical protein [Massilia sp. Se16.2.3]
MSSTSSTPGSACTRRSISQTQAAQRMPSTVKLPSPGLPAASTSASSGASVTVAP